MVRLRDDLLGVLCRDERRHGCGTEPVRPELAMDLESATIAGNHGSEERNGPVCGPDHGGSRNSYGDRWREMAGGHEQLPSISSWDERDSRADYSDQHVVPLFASAGHYTNQWERDNSSVHQHSRRLGGGAI
jgi:hypothetical protein